MLRNARKRGRDLLLLILRRRADVKHVDFYLRLRRLRTGRLLREREGRREREPQGKDFWEHSGIVARMGLVIAGRQKRTGYYRM